MLLAGQAKQVLRAGGQLCASVSLHHPHCVSSMLLRRAQACRGAVWPGLQPGTSPPFPVLLRPAGKPPFPSLDLPVAGVLRPLVVSILRVCPEPPHLLRFPSVKGPLRLGSLPGGSPGVGYEGPHLCRAQPLGPCRRLPRHKFMGSALCSTYLLSEPGPPGVGQRGSASVLLSPPACPLSVLDVRPGSLLQCRTTNPSLSLSFSLFFAPSLPPQPS